MAKSSEPSDVSSNSPSGGMSGTTTSLLAIAAITTVVGFAAFFATLFNSKIDPGQATLDIANKQFRLGHYKVAEELANRAVLPDGADDELKSVKDYIIGASKASEAMLIDERKRRRTELHSSLSFLQTASQRWPEGRQDEGERLLGLTYFEIGDFKNAATTLRECAERNPTMREELIPYIAKAYLYGEKADAQLAIDMLDQWEPSVRESDENLQNRSLRAQCLLRLGQYSEARKILAAVEARLNSQGFEGNSDNIEMGTEIRLLSAMADVMEAIDKYGRGDPKSLKPNDEIAAQLVPAMEKLESMRLDATPEFANQASLWSARALACIGRAQDALFLLSTVRQQQPFEGANIAAGIEEIEWLAELGNGEEVLQTVRYLMREIGDEMHYDGSSVDLDTFRIRLVAALQNLRRQERFSHCLSIAQTMAALFPEADSLYEEAVTHRAAADQLSESLGSAKDEENNAASLAAKQTYRMAGEAFAKSAKLRFDTEQYCNTLWEAIEAYLKSGQFQICGELLEDYLRYETRPLQPRALLAIGKTRLAAGNCAGALEALEECIVEFPRDPMRYDARLAAAAAHAELNEFDKAQSLLDANLTDGGLTPDSAIWRDSLYTMGEILFRQANETHLAWELKQAKRDPAQPLDLKPLKEQQPTIESAILRLREAATRYWPDARAKHAAYLSARANKLAAVWPRLESRSTDVLDVAKRQLRLQADQYLQTALTSFVSLRRDLAAREEEQTLSLSQQTMLRNCYVEEADTLFELGKYEQAADAFRAVSLRYMNEPTALEALLGQWRCLQELKRMREARLIIRQAVVVLGRIPPEADSKFTETTRYDRKRWEELLTWLDAGPIPEDTDA